MGQGGSGGGSFRGLGGTVSLTENGQDGGNAYDGTSGGGGGGAGFVNGGIGGDGAGINPSVGGDGGQGGSHGAVQPGLPGAGAIGGDGEDGHNATNTGDGGGGGGGGFGAVVTGAVTSGTLSFGAIGGSGGNGGSGAPNIGDGGGGGGGGTGLQFQDTVSGVSFEAAISGGGGGNGGNHSPSLGWGGSGGAGGNGLFFEAATYGLTINAAVTGGEGGEGIVGTSAFRAGKGGAGGTAVTFSGEADVTIAGTSSIGGGDGGDGNAYLGSAGAGGRGILALGGGTIIVEASAVVFGGNGGAAHAGVEGVAGLGGVGILGSGGDLSIVTAGSISGGLGGDGVTRANAIELASGSNALTLQAGYGFLGNVVTTSGTTDGGDTLTLGGTQAASFDVGQVVPTLSGSLAGTQYVGFNRLGVDGGVWTVTGANASGLSWNLDGGTLSIADAQTLQGSGTPLSTSFDGGTLRTTATMSLSGETNIGAGGATFETAAGTTATLSKRMVGDGAFTKTGAGTLKLGATSDDFTGAALISEGTLALSGSIEEARSVTVNATLDISGTNTGTTVKILSGTSSGSIVLGSKTLTVNQQSSNGFAGVISGSGGLVKQGAGTLFLTGANTYEGDTLVSAGTLQIGFGGTTGSVVSDIEVEAGAGVIFSRSDARTYAGELSGSGTVKTRGGTLRLTGDSSAFTGTTAVEDNSGLMLASTGKLGGTTTAKSLAWIGGTGALGSAVLESNSTLTPGDAPGEIGTLSLTGALTLKSGSTFAVDLGAANAGDKVAVTGAASIDAGATLDITAHEPYELGAHYTLLTSSSLTGEFGTVTGDVGAVSAFFSAEVVYDDGVGLGSVFLDVMQVRAIADAAFTRNQIATAWGVDSLPIGNDLFDAVAWLPTDAAARAAFDLLSGEIHASGKTVLIEDTQFLRNAVYDRLIGAGSGAPPAGMSVAPLGYAAPVKAAAPFPMKAAPVAAPAPASAVWTQAFGGWGSMDGNGNAADLDRDAGGFFIGADTLVAETWRLGVLGGYSRSTFDVDARASSGEADNYHAGLYAGASWGALALRAGASYTWSDVDTSRAVAFPGYADYLTASYDAGTAQAFGELSYKFGSVKAALEPFAGLAYVSLETDGFTENGGDAALTTSSSTTDVTYTTLGLRASSEFALGEALATVRGMAGWRHAFGDTTPLSTFAFDGGLPFVVGGLPIAEDALLVEAGIDISLSDAISLGVTYSGQFGDGSQMQGIQGNLAWRF